MVGSTSRTALGENLLQFCTTTINATVRGNHHGKRRRYSPGERSASNGTATKLAESE